MKNKYLRRIQYLIIFLLILSLFAYENVISYDKRTEEFGLENYMSNPEKYGGYEKQHFGTITEIHDDYFYFNSIQGELKVYGKGVEKAKFGETVFLLRYRKDGVIELVDYHNYNYNYFLYFISFVALIIFLYIFFREWRFTLKGFEDA